MCGTFEPILLYVVRTPEVVGGTFGSQFHWETEMYDASSSSCSLNIPVDNGLST